MGLTPPIEISDEARVNAPISATTIVGVSTLYLALATGFTGTRLYTRYTIYQQFWWDDWSMILAWIGTIALCILLIIMMQHGGGLNIEDDPITDVKRYLEIFQDLQVVARLSMFFAKLSLLLLYIRLFFPKGVTRSLFWWIIQAIVWLNLLYTVGLIFAIALQCVPYHKPYGTSCMDQYMVLVSSSIINIISDLLILIIPMASVWQLNMKYQRKWAVWALFAFGTMAPLSSIARLAYQIPTADGTDSTVIYTIVVLLALTEQVIAIVAGNAPVISAWFVRLVRKKTSHDVPRPGAAANLPRTVTERVWPDREGEADSPHDRRLRKWRRSKASDPYPTLTTVQGTTSEEAPDPGLCQHGQPDVECGHGVEMWDLSGNASALGDDKSPTRQK